MPRPQLIPHLRRRRVPHIRHHPGRTTSRRTIRHRRIIRLTGNNPINRDLPLHAPGHHVPACVSDCLVPDIHGGVAGRPHAPVEIGAGDLRERDGGGVHEDGGGDVFGGLPARGCCAVNGCDGELAWGIGVFGSDGEALQEVVGVGKVCEVAAVGDCDGAVDGELVGCLWGGASVSNYNGEG